MLGVYLGLLANNWNESKKERKLTNQVLTNIAKEIEGNQSIVEASLDYFTQLTDTTYLYIINKEEVNPSSFSFWQGLNPPLLKDASYNSATITGLLSNFELDLIEQLSATYSLQEDLADQAKNYIVSITNKIGTNDFNDNKYLIILRNYSYDQVIMESELLSELKKTSELIKTKIQP